MARRLVALIETHADALTSRLVARLREHPGTIGFRKYDDLELGRRAREIYSHLGFWLRSSSEPEIEAAMKGFGRAERAQGLPLSDVVGALLLTRRCLWEFAEGEAGDSVLDLRQELDLQLLVVRFFDRAVYWTVRGYEEAGPVEARAAERTGAASHA